MLNGGLEVQVQQNRGAWANIKTLNGWTGWVDARRLQPFSPMPLEPAASEAPDPLATPDDLGEAPPPASPLLRWATLGVGSLTVVVVLLGIAVAVIDAPESTAETAAPPSSTSVATSVTAAAPTSEPPRPDPTAADVPAVPTADPGLERRFRVVAEIDKPLLPLTGGEGSIWVAEWPSGPEGFVLVEGTVYRIDSAADAISATIRLGADHIRALAVGFDDVWAETDGTLYRIDSTTNQIVAEVPMETRGHLAIGNSAAWTISGVSPGELTKIDPATNKIIPGIPMGERPALIGAGHGAVWVADQDQLVLHRLDEDTGELTATIDNIGSAGALAIDSRGVWIFDTFAPAGRNRLLLIDPESAEVVQEILVSARIGFLIDSMAIEGDTLWLSRYSDDGGLIQRIALPSGEVREEIVVVARTRVMVSQGQLLGATAGNPGQVLSGSS